MTNYEPHPTLNRRVALLSRCLLPEICDRNPRFFSREVNPLSLAQHYTCELLKTVVTPEGVEPPTLCSEGRCSIQLSYGAVLLNCRAWLDRTPRAAVPHTCVFRSEISAKNWGGKRESNPQPSEPQSGALPVELFPPLRLIIAIAVEQRQRRNRGQRSTLLIHGLCLRTRIPRRGGGWSPEGSWCRRLEAFSAGA